jgi:hypothetical protein
MVEIKGNTQFIIELAKRLGKSVKELRLCCEIK